MVERPAKGMIIMLALPHSKRVKILDTTLCIVVQPDLQFWDNSMLSAEYCTALQAINHHHLFRAFLKPNPNCWIFEPGWTGAARAQSNRVCILTASCLIASHLVSDWTHRVADDEPTSAHDRFYERAIDLIGILLLGFFSKRFMIRWSMINHRDIYFISRSPDDS